MLVHTVWISEQIATRYVKKPTAKEHSGRNSSFLVQLLKNISLMRFVLVYTSCGLKEPSVYTDVKRVEAG